MFCFSVCEYMKIMYAVCGLRNENEMKIKAEIAFIINILLVTSHFSRVF